MHELFFMICSPLTANIYLPALTIISSSFQKSVELVNLSVTVYMVFQGLCMCNDALQKNNFFWLITHKLQCFGVP